jgi:hypothetical protein
VVLMPDFSVYTDEANLRYHWGTVYDIRQVSRWKWVAVARWGNQDMLTSDTADGLRSLIHRHYGPRTHGYAEAKKIGR